MLILFFSRCKLRPPESSAAKLREIVQNADNFTLARREGNYTIEEEKFFG